MAYRRDIGISDANQVVDTLVRTLQKGDEGGGGFIISEILKAGSLGHGTAVKGHYDLDMVIYSDSIDGDRVLKEGFEGWLTIMERFLDRKFLGRISERDRSDWLLQYRFDDKIEVDMLVSPFWRDRHDFYHFLQRIDPGKRLMFSVSASRWQVDFFKRKPNQVKEFIKRAKAWRNSVWEGVPLHDGKPKSFLISVLVLKAYENATEKLGDTSTRSIALQTTAELKTIVKNHTIADIYWEEYYRKGDYTMFPSSLPRIMDPANPSNNLYETGIGGGSNKKARDYREGGGKWDNFVHYIDTLDLTQTVDEIQGGNFDEIQGENFKVEEAKRVVKELVEKIEQNFRGFNISEIVESGSLGHGTGIRGKFDIDLVIYSRDITGEDIKSRGYSYWLEQLYDFLQLNYRQNECEFLRDKSNLLRSVPFKFKSLIDVDLLVSPYWADQHKFYQFLRGASPKERNDLTVSASKWQVQFFKKQPPQVKELIRKAKEWRNEQWPGDQGEGRPVSYLMSLLVVGAYERNPKNVKETIIQLVESPDLCWESFYAKRDYPDLLPSRPRVVDPANPANNVWISGIRGRNSTVLKRKIHTINL